METTRAFIAIEVPDGIREKIVEASRALNGKEVRGVPEDQMHITLFFFEDATKEQIASLIEILERLKEKEFQITIKGAGVFTPDRPRVIFIDIEDKKEIKRLHSLINMEIRKAGGLPLEKREFHPHLTVARIKRSDREIEEKLEVFLEENKGREFGTFACKELKLIESALTKEGPIHEVIFTKKLG